MVHHFVAVRALEQKLLSRMQRGIMYFKSCTVGYDLWHRQILDIENNGPGKIHLSTETAFDAPIVSPLVFGQF